MSGTEWTVVIAGLAAIAWVNWYFFVAQAGTQAAGTSGEPTRTTSPLEQAPIESAPEQ